MYIKIYFNNKPLFLSDKIYPDMEEYYHHDDTVLIDELSTHAIQSMIHEMQKENIHAGILLHENPKELKKAFFKKFTHVPAAGGLVVNENNEVLFIYRRGCWDLPKGKQDEWEDIRECAVREVEEETGIKVEEVSDKYTETYHSYDEFGKHILKKTTWYLMYASSEQNVRPQTEEDIHDIHWVKRDALEEYLRQTYPNIVDVVKKLLPEAE